MARYRQNGIDFGEGTTGVNKKQTTEWEGRWQDHPERRKYLRAIAAAISKANKPETEDEYNARMDFLAAEEEKLAQQTRDIEVSRKLGPATRAMKAEGYDELAMPSDKTSVVIRRP